MSGLPQVPEVELTPQSLTFDGDRLSPSPFHYRFTGEDFLELASMNSAPGAIVAVQGRTWTPERGISPFAFTHIPATDRTRTLQIFGLARGFLLNVVVFASAGTPKLGQTFVSLHVIRGAGQARVLLATLVQGYVTANQELAFPGSAIGVSGAVTPFPRMVAGTDPAAGAEISEVVPTNTRWRVIAVTFVFDTGAGVGSRRVRLTFDDGLGGDEVLLAQPNSLQVASETVFYNFWIGCSRDGANIGGVMNYALPSDHWLSAGARIRTSTVGMFAADNYRTPQFFVNELLEAG